MARDPKSYRSAEFLAGNRALRLSDLSPTEAKTAVSLVSDASKNTRKGMREVINRPVKKLATGGKPTEHEYQKANKAKEALPDAVNKPYSPTDAVEARITNMTRAATDHRLPGEDIGGAGFYFQHRREVEGIIKGTDTDLGTALDAGSKLSVRTKPDAEKESLHALIHAHQNGAVHFGPNLVSALHGLGNGKVSVPAEHVGQTVPFGRIHPEIASALTNPAIRDVSKQHVTNVDLDSLAKTAITRNITAAHSVMQGNKSSPYDNPKQISYASAHAISHPNSPEELEYKDRTRKLGEILRTGGYQESFDFDNLRHSNEGVLSNEASTPADIWERRVGYGQKGKAFTTSSDSNYVSKKSRVTASGKKQTVGDRDTMVTPIGIEHAVHQDAVHQAAKEVQHRFGLDFTVPATLVQETNWAGARRSEGQDSDYNSAKAELEAHTANVGKQFRPKAPKANPNQPTLFD